MTFKIVKDTTGRATTIRLIGRIQAEQLDELKAQMRAAGPRIVLDLDEITLVDVVVVRYLCACEKNGIELLHCSPYIREWILRERES